MQAKYRFHVWDSYDPFWRFSFFCKVIQFWRKVNLAITMTCYAFVIINVVNKKSVSNVLYLAKGLFIFWCTIRCQSEPNHERTHTKSCIHAISYELINSFNVLENQPHKSITVKTMSNTFAIIVEAIEIPTTMNFFLSAHISFTSLVALATFDVYLYVFEFIFCS